MHLDFELRAYRNTVRRDEGDEYSSYQDNWKNVERNIRARGGLLIGQYCECRHQVRSNVRPSYASREKRNDLSALWQQC